MPGASAGRYCQPARTTLAPITCASGVGPSPRSSANSLTDRPLVKIAPLPDSSLEALVRVLGQTGILVGRVGIGIRAAAA